VGKPVTSQGITQQTQELAEVFSRILDNCCPTEIHGKTRVFRIETHCVGWTITAKKTEYGWAIETVEIWDN
jgi:hypothetical protein